MSSDNNLNSNETKQCTKCGIEKDLGSFYIKNGRHQASCKACCLKYFKDKEYSKTPAFKAATKKWRQSAKGIKFYRDYYATGKFKAHYDKFKKTELGKLSLKIGQLNQSLERAKLPETKVKLHEKIEALLKERKDLKEMILMEKAAKSKLRNSPEFEALIPNPLTRKSFVDGIVGIINRVFESIDSYTLEEVSNILGLSTSTIIIYARRGKIPATKVGSKLKFNKKVVNQIAVERGKTVKTIISAKGFIDKVKRLIDTIKTISLPETQIVEVMEDKRFKVDQTNIDKEVVISANNIVNALNEISEIKPTIFFHDLCHKYKNENKITKKTSSIIDSKLITYFMNMNIKNIDENRVKTFYHNMYNNGIADKYIKDCIRVLIDVLKTSGHELNYDKCIKKGVKRVKKTVAKQLVKEKLATKEQKPTPVGYSFTDALQLVHTENKTLMAHTEDNTIKMYSKGGNTLFMNKSGVISKSVNTEYLSLRWAIV